MPLRVSHISHKYPRGKSHIHVLNDINFVINRGEFVAIVGPSGSGKTTLANIILGYIKPSNGEITTGGKKIQDSGKDRIPIGQENDLFDWMTVHQNMRIATCDEGMISKCLKMVHLNTVRDVYPVYLSGGMKKRVSLARAIAANPDIIIMDEPFASIDHQLKIKLHEDVTQIHKTLNNSIMLVTHDIEEALFLSSRVIVLGGNPASVQDEINIAFEYPRIQAIKESEQFTKYKHRILKVLGSGAYVE